MPTAHAKTPAVTPVPESRGATPYLTIKGASDAIAFYQRVFGAELLFRIDDPSGGWKGRAMWATSSNRTVFHSEPHKEARPKVIKFQLRPDPLAR